MFHFDRDFTDKNGERYMLPIRIQSLMRELQNKYVIRKEYDTGDFEFYAGDVPFSQLDAHTPWVHFRAGETLWGEPDQWAWFRQSITIPTEFAGEDIWYTIYPYTIDADWHWAHPQAQLFVNGVCVFGLDCNHRKYLLCKHAKGGERLEIAIKAYSDLTYYAGRMTMSARLQVLRPTVYELYQSLAVPMKAASCMSSDSAERVHIVKQLNRAMTMLAIGAEPESEEFRTSVCQTREFLERELYATMRSGAEPTLWSIGHSHIDVAWQWTYHVSRNKAARTFATNLKLLEENPDYLFMASQPALYEYVKEDEPQLYRQVCSRIAQGRWEPEGGMYVEADTNLTGGESLVRQFLIGKQFFREEFGTDSRILWLPDVFGYSANLPQICRRSGIDYFYTTKIGWNEYNKLPYDTFRWRGLDGSTILTHFGCAIAYADIETDWMTTYNPSLEPSFVLGAWKRFQQKDISHDLLYDFGYGDGGGGPTQEMIDYGRRFAAGIPGCPNVKFARALDFFRHLEEEVSDDPHLPEWDGEMYLEFHRGTYTSQAKTKKNNRRSEQLYHDVENLWSFVGLLGGNEAYPAKELAENWKLILLNQFHDVLPGSSIARVYEDAQAHYERILSRGEQMKQDALDALTARLYTNGDTLVVFNTLSFSRDPIVIFDGILHGLRDEDGTFLPCQRTYDGKTVFRARNVPPKGWKSYTICEAPPAPTTLRISPHEMESDTLRVTFDEHMHITSLYSKLAARETLPAGSVGGRLIAYDDVARTDDNWNVQAYYREKGYVLDDVSAVEVLESGPVRGVVQVTRKFRNSTVRMRLSVCVGSPILRYDFDVDWHEHNLFVKAEHPVAVNAKNASYEIQFGYVQRPVHKNTLWDFARFEVCGHKYADLSDSGFGLAVLNDCKYGYDATRNSLNLTLLKCSTYPDKMCDIGAHSFSYALYPHAEDLLSARVRDLAYDFNYPVSVRRLSAQRGDLPRCLSLLHTDAPNVVIETVKKAEASEDIVVRLYEAENRSTDCVLSLPRNIVACTQADLMEQAEHPLTRTEDGALLHFDPFEIKTVLLRCGKHDPITYKED